MEPTSELPGPQRRVVTETDKFYSPFSNTPAKCLDVGRVQQEPVEVRVPRKPNMTSKIEKFVLKNFDL
jgi:hypothetical protein